MTEHFLRNAMEHHGDMVYRLALCRMQSVQDAEDVYQDVFMRLYGDATEFTSSEHLKAWLLRVTINRCRDLAKSNWNRHTVAFDPVRDDIAELVRDPRDADVWDAVGQLPDNLRSSVHLSRATPPTRSPACCTASPPLCAPGCPAPARE